MSNATRFHSRLQGGSTLLVAVVILLLASLMALMAMNVGVFEQRSSGNDLRAKVVHQAAEAGLTQGFETLMRGNPAWLDDVSLWDPCPANDETFPCGAVPAARRGSMWRLKADAARYGSAGIDGLPEELRQYMLPDTAQLPAMGAFGVAYGAAPVLCRVPAGEVYPVSQINCSTSSDPAAWDAARRVVTFVSVAKIRGDSGRTTLTQTFARGSLLAIIGGVPAVVASGAGTGPSNSSGIRTGSRPRSRGSTMIRTALPAWRCYITSMGRSATSSRLWICGLAIWSSPGRTRRSSQGTACRSPTSPWVR